MISRSNEPKVQNVCGAGVFSHSKSFYLILSYGKQFYNKDLWSAGSYTTALFDPWCKLVGNHCLNSFYTVVLQRWIDVAGDRFITVTGQYIKQPSRVICGQLDRDPQPRSHL